MSAHTPGPWPGAPDKISRLIAAAPDMLRALQRITHPAADDDDVAFALEVIARATGSNAMLEAGYDPRQSPDQDEDDAIYNAEQHG